jgi:hypothetical protein
VKILKLKIKELKISDIETRYYLWYYLNNIDE